MFSKLSSCKTEPPNVVFGLKMAAVFNERLCDKIIFKKFRIFLKSSGGTAVSLETPNLSYSLTNFHFQKIGQIECMCVFIKTHTKYVYSSNWALFSRSKETKLCRFCLFLRCFIKSAPVRPMQRFLNRNCRQLSDRPASGGLVVASKQCTFLHTSKQIQMLHNIIFLHQTLKD
jgi:hypothetical protein